MAHTAKSSLGWLRDLLADTAKEDGAPMPPSNEAAFDPEQLQTCCGGSSVTARRVLEAVLDRGPELLDAIEVARAERDEDGLMSHIHDLRGVTQILGSYAPAHTCLRLELLGERSPEEERNALLVSLRKESGLLFDAIRAYLRAWPA